MKSSRNKTLWWLSATGNRPRGKLKKVSLAQFVRWTKDWEAFSKAPRIYYLAPNRQLVALPNSTNIFLREICNECSPAALLGDYTTLYYDHEFPQAPN